MNYELISRSPLFRGLTPVQVEMVISSFVHRLKSFRNGAVIAGSGDLVASMMIVTKGFVKGEMTDYSGRLIKIEDISAPGALAPAFMFGNRNRYPVDIIAGSDVEILAIPKQEFLGMLISDRNILVNFLDMISNRSQFLSEKIRFLNFRTIKGKLAFYLLEKAGKSKSSIRLDMTQNDLADFFGVTRPSVGRALGEMEKDGYIEAKGKNISILDRAGLAMLESD